MARGDIVRGGLNALGIGLGVLLNSPLPLRLGWVSEDVGTVSRSLPTALDPAGYTFVIWAPIFLGWTAFGVYGLLPKGFSRPWTRRLGVLPGCVGILLGVWTVAFTGRHLALSLGVMVVLLALLLTMSEASHRSPEALTRGERGWTFIPIDLNLGWLAVAVLPNTAHVLRYRVGWEGAPLTPERWTVVLIVVAVGVALERLLRGGSLGFACAVAWGSRSSAFSGVGAWASRARWPGGWAASPWAGMRCPSPPGALRSERRSWGWR